MARSIVCPMNDGGLIISHEKGHLLEVGKDSCVPGAEEELAQMVCGRIAHRLKERVDYLITSGSHL